MSSLVPIHVRVGCPGLAMRLLWLIIAAIGMLGQLTSATSAEIPYLTDLEAARKLAAEQNKIVILYTGRVQFCENGDPKKYFFQTVIDGYPKLAARANRYVVCEQFLYSNMFGPDGRLSKQFQEESNRLEKMYERYDLRLYYPTVTFLNPDGELLNGPFTTMKKLCEPRFLSIERDCYETLSDYANADQPRTLRQAQADLAAAAIRPAGEPLNFGIYRYRHHPAGGQKTLLLDTGLPSDQYELLDAVPYVVRDAAADIVPTTKTLPNCDIHATGSLENGESGDIPVIVRLNGAHFRATLRPVDDFTGAGSVKFRPNEYHAWVQVRQRQIADQLVRGFRQLQNKAPDGKVGDTHLAKRMMREEFDRQLCAKVGTELEFPADRLIVEDHTAERQERYPNSLVRLLRMMSIDRAFLPLQFTFAKLQPLGVEWTESDSKTTAEVMKLASGHLLLVQFREAGSSGNHHELVARIPSKDMEVRVKLTLPRQVPGGRNNPPAPQTYAELLSGPRENLSKRLVKCIEFAVEAVEAGSVESARP